MLLDTHPRLRITGAFIPAIVMVAALVAAAATDSWGYWTAAIVIGLGWFAIWAPIEAMKPSVRVRIGLTLAGLAFVIAGVVVLIVYNAAS